MTTDDDGQAGAPRTQPIDGVGSVGGSLAPLAGSPAGALPPVEAAREILDQLELLLELAEGAQLSAASIDLLHRAKLEAERILSQDAADRPN